MTEGIVTTGSSEVEETLISQIRRNHDLANAAAQEAIEYAIKVGTDLLRLKEIVPHGQWADYIYKHFPFKVRTAQNYMRLARDPEKTQRVAHLGVKGALAELAQPKSQPVVEAIGDDPEAIAEAITKADPETQRRIADAIVTSPTVEPSLEYVAAPKERQPRPMKSIGQTVEEATFGLWDASQRLMDEVPSGEERVRIVASAEKAQRLAAGIAMLLNSGQVDDAFRDLVAEMEVPKRAEGGPEPLSEKSSVVDFPLNSDRARAMAESAYQRFVTGLSGMTGPGLGFLAEEFPIERALAVMDDAERSEWITSLKSARSLLHAVEQKIEGAR